MGNHIGKMINSKAVSVILIIIPAIILAFVIYKPDIFVKSDNNGSKASIRAYRSILQQDVLGRTIELTKLLDVMAGKEISWDDYYGEHKIIIFFTTQICSRCPIYDMLSELIKLNYAWVSVRNF